MELELMSAERLRTSLALPDLSDPRNGVHAINLAIESIRKAVKKNYPTSPLEMYRKDPIVTVHENFDALLFPSDNAGRSSRYTRYVSSDQVLRTHTSSAIPGKLKDLATQGVEDVILLIPGMCYRRDVVDKTHCGEPHQMDVWRIKKGSPRLKRTDLLMLIKTVMDGILPGYEYRANEVLHPYTIHGLEVEVSVGGKWLEILECGEVHPTILRNSGLDPEEYSGLAMGMGLDRLVMVVKGIDDIRILRSTNPRIQQQMTNLNPYVAVSNQPAATRVLSYSTHRGKTEEDVCEQIQDLLKDNVQHLEQIVVEEIPYESLTEKARNNLGIKATQKNIVVTLTFRSMTSSLPKETIRAWVTDLYHALNEGENGYL